MNSPLKNQNKGYESPKQEKYDLMHDNPVAKDASGGRSWMSKHSKSHIGSPLHGEGRLKDHLGTPPHYRDGLKREEWGQHRKNSPHHKPKKKA